MAKWVRQMGVILLSAVISRTGSNLDSRITTRFSGIVLILVALIFARPVAAQIVNGQIDTFQDGTTQNWTNGSSAAPPVTNVATGGPAGSGDRFIQVTSDSGGPGSRLTTFNLSQWTGNYIGQAVTTIEMDLENLGSSQLFIRLAFRSSSGPSFTPGYLSASFSLAPNSGWQHATFSIAIADMTPINSPTAYNTFFSNVGEFRIINELGATNLTGDIVTAQLGIDNIHAIPESNTAILIVTGVTLILILGRRTRG